MRTLLAILTVLFAGLAAFCWFKAGTAKVSPGQADIEREKHFAEHGRSGYAAWTMFDGADMEFTLRAQAKWNRFGAGAAAASAVCQGLYIAVAEFVSA